MTPCKNIENVYQKYCKDRYLRKDSPEYLLCSNVLQSLHHCQVTHLFENYLTKKK
jgi:hypothetical protein